MRIDKASQGGGHAEVTEGDLALINTLARRALRPEEIYTFSVRLCDNEVDRDGERFAPQTLEELAGLFAGKCGIFDHQWSARGQAARLYRTEVVREPGRTTRAGDGYCWLKGCAYMMRTDRTRDLIAEIEGGIKREVSVGCAVKKRVCSVCGGDMDAQGGCGHRKGEVYGGKLCYASLEGASDAYEFSFVAVPAQPEAGVVKGAAPSLKTLAGQDPGCARELKLLEEQSRLGRRYLEQLRRETVRLAMLAGSGLEKAFLEQVAGKLSWEELETVKAVWEKQAAARYPLQLRYGERTSEEPQRDGAFLI